jgi:hypothetical protein
MEPERNRRWPWIAIFIFGMVLFAACDDSDDSSSSTHQHGSSYSDGSSDLSGVDGGISDDRFDPQPACGPFTPGC